MKHQLWSNGVPAMDASPVLVTTNVCVERFFKWKKLVGTPWIIHTDETSTLGATNTSMVESVVLAAVFTFGTSCMRNRQVLFFVEKTDYRNKLVNVRRRGDIRYRESFFSVDSWPKSRLMTVHSDKIPNLQTVWHFETKMSLWWSRNIRKNIRTSE